MKPLTPPALGHSELLERLQIGLRQPHLQLFLHGGQSLAGQALNFDKNSLVLGNRDGVWFVQVDQISAISLSSGDCQQLCGSNNPHESLTKLGLTRFISAESPPGWTIQVDEVLLVGQDFGWLRPWVTELAQAIVNITADSLGMAALEPIQGFVLTTGPEGSVVNRNGRVEIAADPKGPYDLSNKLLALL